MRKKEKIMRITPRPYAIKVWCDGKVIVFMNEQTNRPICGECFCNYRKITMRSDR